MLLLHTSFRALLPLPFPAGSVSHLRSALSCAAIITTLKSWVC